MSNQFSKTGTGHEGGVGGGTRDGSRGRMAPQSVLAQLGVGSGGRNLGEQREITMGTWSEPVDRSGVSHLLTARVRRQLEKTRSRTDGLDVCVNGKWV